MAKGVGGGEGLQEAGHWRFPRWRQGWGDGTQDHRRACGSLGLSKTRHDKAESVTCGNSRIRHKDLG